MVKKKKKKKFKKNKTFNKKVLKRHIIDILYETPKKSYNYKQIASVLCIIDPENKKLINIALEELKEDNKVEEVQRGKFKIIAQSGYLTGVIDLTRQGFGYLVSDESKEDVFIAQANLKNAMDGDKVTVLVYPRHKKRRLEGEVTEIIERARTSFVGTIQMSRNYAFLVPSVKMNFDLFIPKEKLKGAKDGQKAIAKITEWPERARNPFGEVIEVLGEAGENETEMHAILAEFDLPYKFPSKVLKAAEKISTEITQEEIDERRDFRSIPTFTIDPTDAKDFDDALSVQQLKNGNWEVGIHIADVTHYIQPSTTLDNEALNRATSVYLVDRVVPMLPEKLSNGVCSLRPHEDKLCFSAVFELNDNADVISQWFGRTIIHSDHRFDYQQAQEIIETGEGTMQEEVLSCNNLATKLREKRFNAGAIAFDRIEVKFNIDEDGKPLGIYFKEAKDSNHLIEEFMLLANKKVAEFIGKQENKKAEKTFVYRIHDKPDPEKLESFNRFVAQFGYGIQLNTPKTISTSLNNLLNNVTGKKEQNVVETLAVRTMAKAEYSTRNIGHYGLSFEHYSHFTSPIRRYPDMMVHRLLDRYLKGGKSANASKYEDMCKHSSDMETKASNAERSSIKYKQVEFMSDKVGQTFQGVISGVTDWGIYVELNENKCEGMIPLHELDDDFYMYDENNYCIIGQRTGNKYQLGEELTVEVVRANLLKKQLDFRLADNEENENI
ncbi:ribonuclease R [Puteibacter caeruleilacunae]|nr:ribonuclease R [Puteibacter caeruleilacunae]